VCASGEEDPEMQRLGHARPAGGGWRFADIENVRGKVQFVFNDGAGLWDSTPVGEEERTFYEADRAGAVCVKDGRLTVVGGGSPVLVVTDLDGTYVGDADAVAAFNDESRPAPPRRTPLPPRAAAPRRAGRQRAGGTRRAQVGAAAGPAGVGAGLQYGPLDRFRTRAHRLRGARPRPAARTRRTRHGRR
jgi:hypothetical protein